MKLKGILSSHGRRAVWEKNQRPVHVETPAPIVHDPQPQPDGTVKCCGARYAKHAHAAHLRGERIDMALSGVRMLQADVEEAEAAFGIGRDPVLRQWRAEMDRPREVRIAEGTDPGPWGW